MAGIPKCVGAILIRVTGGRAIVGMVVERGESVQFDYARNWRELEDAAVLAVHRQGGFLSADGYYTCPDVLRVEARWQA